MTKNLTRSLTILLIATLLFLQWQFNIIPSVKAEITTAFDVVSDAYDKRVLNMGAYYVTVHDATSGLGADDILMVGQDHSEESHSIFRLFILFNTSALNGAEITAAKLCLYGQSDTSDADFVIRLQKWTESSDGITTADYDGFDGTNYDDGLYSTSSFQINVYQNITITNFSLISTDGTNTPISIRSAEDINSSPPDVDIPEDVVFENTGAAGTHPPILEVTYTPQEVSTVTLNSPSDNADFEKTSKIDFKYTPVFLETIQNSSLWTNATGTWASTQTNTTTITNNAENMITYTFTSDGVYIWNVGVYNSTTEIFAGANRTITIETFYNYVDNNTSNEDSSADKGTHSDFESEKAVDGMDTLTEADQAPVEDNSENFVDNNSSDVDSHANHGTSTNFTTQQYADSIYDTVTEEATTEGYPESYIYCNNFQDPSSVWDTETDAYDNDTGTSASCDVVKSTWSGYLVLNLSMTALGTTIQYWVSRSSTKITTMEIDVANQTGDWTNVYSGEPTYSGGKSYENQTFASAMYTAMRFRFACGAVASTAYLHEAQGWNASKTANYELDYEFQWTTTDYDETNEYLCIHTGIANWGAEDILVQVRDGASWKTLFSDLTSNTWNNITLGGNLTSGTLTIRFLGGTESSDAAQDSWDIECSLIHVWSVGVNYELDLEIQWTDTNYTRTNEELCVKTGTTDAEDIKVYVWYSSAWTLLDSDLDASGWNNYTVTTYLLSATFTVRFLGGTETSDSNQDTWQIDCALLHTWEGEAGNTAPIINQLRLSLTSSEENITTIDVCTWYDWEVNVTDDDNLSDIYNLTIRIENDPSATISEDSPSYNQSKAYWFRYLNASDGWEWYSGSAWTSTSDWLNVTGCLYPTKTETNGWYLFRVRLSKVARHSSLWEFTALVYDSADNTATKNFAGISVNSWAELIVTPASTTHTWSNIGVGSENVLIDEGTITINVTCNYEFNLQAQGNASYLVSSGEHQIGIGNITIHKDTLESSISLTITYANIGGLTGLNTLSPDTQYTFKLWLSIPSGTTPWEDYQYKCVIQVVEAS